MNNIQILSDYIKAITKNICIDETIDLDLVISGGAFNGTYAIGSVMLIKQLELENKIKVDKISACSIGSIVGLSYIMNNFNMTNQLFVELKKCLKINSNAACLREIVSKCVYLFFKSDEKMKTLLNNRFYLSYNDISDCSFHVIKEYTDREHLIDCMTRTMFVPYLINGSLKLDNRYIDGIYPYIFKNSDKKVLYVELIKDSTDLMKCIVTQKEKNEHYRVIQGVSDAAKFFQNEGSERLSWYGDWSIIKIAKYNIIYLTLMIIVILLDFLSSINIPTSIKESKLMTLVQTSVIKTVKDIVSKLHD